jgi:hypothetical protein
MRKPGEDAHRNRDYRTTEEFKMFNKTATILAAAVVLGSTWSARAYWQDPNTGLPMEYYYGPVAEHAKQGLPVRAETVKKYAPSQQKGAVGATVSSNRGSNIRLPEARPHIAPVGATVFPNRGSDIRLLEARPHIVPVGADDKHSGHLW